MTQNLKRSGILVAAIILILLALDLSGIWRPERRATDSEAANALRREGPAAQGGIAGPLHTSEGGRRENVRGPARGIDARLLLRKAFAKVNLKKGICLVVKTGGRSKKHEYIKEMNGVINLRIDTSGSHGNSFIENAGRFYIVKGSLTIAEPYMAASFARGGDIVGAMLNAQGNLPDDSYSADDVITGSGSDVIKVTQQYSSAHIAFIANAASQISTTQGIGSAVSSALKTAIPSAAVYYIDSESGELLATNFLDAAGRPSGPYTGIVTSENDPPISDAIFEVPAGNTIVTANNASDTYAYLSSQSATRH
jgi:hypothetical protein